MRAQTFVPSDDLPELDGAAPAFRHTDESGRARFDELAELFGIEGEVVEGPGGTLAVDGERLGLSLIEGTWSVFQTQVIPPVPGAGETGSSTFDDGMPSPIASDDVAELPGLPSEEEARRVALDTLDATGMDTEDAAITVEKGSSLWSVDVEPRVDGLPAPGLTATVMVGPGGRIENAMGNVDGLEELGEYPLAGTSAVVDRLNHGWLDTPPFYDVVSRGAGGPEVEVTGAELVLTNQIGWDGNLYLVPGYRLVSGDGDDQSTTTQVVAAVTDDVIDRRLDRTALAERPEREDLDEPPPIGAVTSESIEVAAPVDDCGIDDIWWDTYRFAALDPPFDAATAPEEYTGVGEFTFFTGVYTDSSGITVQFTEVDPERAAPSCG
jgi:hypothetical protein